MMTSLPRSQSESPGLRRELDPPETPGEDALMRHGSLPHQGKVHSDTNTPPNLCPGKTKMIERYTSRFKTILGY